MLSRIDLRGAALPGPRELAQLLPRAATDIDSVLAVVRPLCEDVRLRGAEAIREITARLDGVDVPEPAVPQAALDEALATIDPSVPSWASWCSRSAAWSRSAAASRWP